MSSPHESFEAALTLLDEEHARRLGKVKSVHEVKDLGQLRAATEDCMRDYYFEPATEPRRNIVRRVDGDNGSRT